MLTVILGGSMKRIIQIATSTVIVVIAAGTLIWPPGRVPGATPTMQVTASQTQATLSQNQSPQSPAELQAGAQAGVPASSQTTAPQGNSILPPTPSSIMYPVPSPTPWPSPVLTPTPQPTVQPVPHPTCAPCGGHVQGTSASQIACPMYCME